MECGSKATFFFFNFISNELIFSFLSHINHYIIEFLFIYLFPNYDLHNLLEDNTIVVVIRASPLVVVK